VVRPPGSTKAKTQSPYAEFKYWLISTGRRKIPIRILRLRRISLKPQFHRPPVHRRSSHCRITPRTFPRSRGCVDSGHWKVPRGCGVDCQHNCVECAYG
jgi:hypothetical protein